MPAKCLVIRVSGIMHVAVEYHDRYRFKRWRWSQHNATVVGNRTTKLIRQYERRRRPWVHLGDILQLTKRILGVDSIRTHQWPSASSPIGLDLDIGEPDRLRKPARLPEDVDGDAAPRIPEPGDTQIFGLNC